MKSSFNTNPEFTITNLFFTHLISKDDFGRHMHDFYEIVYITDGEAQHEVGKRKDTLYMGDVVIIPPHQYHCWLREADSVFTHRDLVVSTDLFKEICDFLSPDFYDSIFTTDAYLKFKLNKSSLQYFESIFSTFSFEHGRTGQNSKSNLSTTKAALASLLSNLITNKKNSKHPQWFETLLEQMHNPDAIKLGLSEILKSVSYNHIYLCRVFKKYIGKTMTDYFNEIRLEYAKLYLISTTKTITGISEELGFSSYTYFYKVFKAQYGVLPKEYRKKHFLPSSSDEHKNQ